MRHSARSVIEAGLAALGLCGAALAQPVAVVPAANLVQLDFGRSDHPLDLGVDLARPVDAGARPLLGSIEAFRIGWRYRTRGEPAWGAARPELRALADAPETRIGIQWKPAPSQIDLLRGDIGLKLEGAEHLSIRLRKGSFGIYLNRKF
jgi:hypothetical protein